MQNQSFWKTKKLNELNIEEWESLCDNCGKCCVIKLIDQDTDELHYTNVSCHLLNTKTCSCNDYQNRKKIVKDCVQLTPKNLQELNWMPNTCAYRLVNEGKDLPEWHPLIQGNKDLMKKENHSVSGRVISETDVNKKNIDKYIFNWDNKD